MDQAEGDGVEVTSADGPIWDIYEETEENKIASDEAFEQTKKDALIVEPSETEHVVLSADEA